MPLEEILEAIEGLDVSDLVPVLETVTAKFAENFGYIDSYATPAEEAPVEGKVIEEGAPSEEVEEMPAEEDVRLSL